ncbi:MAG: hypothetical protein WA988_12950 [Candidatus Nanopelagicales bacterium]
MKRVLVGGLAVAAMTGGLLAVAPTAASAAGPCNGGTYNYKQSLSGACAWGNINWGVAPSGGGKVTLAVVLKDNTPTNGECAVFDIRVAKVGPDESYHYTRCGSGSTPITRTFYGPSWTYTAVQVRVGSGGRWTSWKKYNF